MKYDIDDQVTVKKEFSVFPIDDDGQEHELTIPEGTKGIIDSTGTSSRYGFRPMYDIVFDIDGDENEVTIFEEDIDDICDVKRVSAIESTESTQE